MQKLEIHSFFKRFIYLLLFFIVSTLNAENFKLKIASYDTNILTLYRTKIEEIKDENGFSSRRIPRSDLNFQKIREHLLQIDADILAIQNLRNETEALNILSEDYSCFVNKRFFRSHRGIGICWKKNKFPISNIQIHKADPPFFLKLSIIKRDSQNYKFQLEKMITLFGVSICTKIRKGESISFIF